MPAAKKDCTIAARIASGILCGGIGGCVFIASYFLYYYAWTGERQFTSPVGPILYYGLPSGLAILSFIALRLKPVYQVNLVLLLLSIVFSLDVAEVVLSLTEPHTATPWLLARSTTDKKKVAEKFGVEFDARSGKEVIFDLRNKGIDAYPHTSPWYLQKKHSDGTIRSLLIIKDTEFLPLAGISDKALVEVSREIFAPRF